MATAMRDGHSIYYEVFGEGPRLLVFNGSGTTIESTRWLLDVLARHFTVLVHDQRGLGKTGLPDGGTQPTMADFAADGKAVLDAQGWDSAAVFGMSFGGMVAQEFAVTYPQMVTRLALLCTSAGGAGGSSYPLHTLAALSPAERERIAIHTLDMRFTPEWLATHPHDQGLVDVMHSGATAEKSDAVKRGEEAQLSARALHDTWSRLDRIACPTLVAAGRFDGLAPLENSQALAGAIAGAEIDVYEGGHLFVVQDQRALPRVTGFLLGE